MSIESWKKEFYLINASEIAKTGNEREIIEHSLTKWRGLTKENLDKHGLIANKVIIKEKEDKDNYFIIGANSCSLCQRYVEKKGSCSGCILYKLRNKTRCDGDNKNDKNNYLSPYTIFYDNNDPKPMIELLEKALEHEKNNPLLPNS